MANPYYNYGIDGEENRQFDVDMALGFRITPMQAVKMNFNSSNDIWVSYTQAF